MTRMKYFASYFVGLLALVSISLFDVELGAMSPDIRVSTFTEAFTNQSSYGLPDDWSVRVWQGTPEIEIVKESQGTVLKLQSHQSNVALYKELEIDLAQHPTLSWEWKVTELPTAGDARDGQRDDQAAGIYVVFPKFPAFLNSRIIGYVWDSDVPQGTILKSQNDSRIHYVVVRSGKEEAGEWLNESRDVGKDYERIFGEKPSTVGGVSLMIDSDHTQSSSESFFGEIYFSAKRLVEVKPSNEIFKGILQARR